MAQAPQHPFARRLAIRGDGTALGVVLIAAAALLLAGSATGTLALSTAGAGALLAASLGATAIGWNRRAYRAMLIGAAARYADHDPGPSPVAWISDRGWRARNRFDAVVDAPTELLAEVDPMVRSFEADARGALIKPVLRPVSDAERQLTPTESLPSNLPLPPRGPLDTLLGSLGQTPGRFIALSARWPVCCGRLSTLDGVQGEQDCPPGVYLAAEGEDLTLDGDRDEAGLHRFQCRECGRRYATDPAW